jgi:hypothetical protein
MFFNVDDQFEQAGGSTILDEGYGAIDQPAGLQHFFVQIQLTGVDPGQIENLVDQVQKMLAALANETDIFGLPRLERPANPGLQHLGEAEDRVEGCAQFMAHIGEELRFGDIGGFSGGLCFVHGLFGQNLFCDVASCSSVAEKPPCLIKEGVAANGNHAFRVVADLAFIDEVTERLVPVQKRQMFLPLGRFAHDVDCQVSAGSANAGLWVLTKRAYVIGQIREPMLLIGLPEPIG